MYFLERVEKKTSAFLERNKKEHFRSHPPVRKFFEAAVTRFALWHDKIDSQRWRRDIARERRHVPRELLDGFEYRLYRNTPITVTTGFFGLARSLSCVQRPGKRNEPTGRVRSKREERNGEREMHLAPVGWLQKWLSTKLRHLGIDPND